MKFEHIQSQLEGIPFISKDQSKILYEFILETKPIECLELGFAHGTSSCYIAAALDELGQGHLTSVDLLDQARDPSIEELLTKTGLESYVSVRREKTSYNWFLKKKIEECSSSGYCEPVYDFCFIDGSKNWTIDGLAFFLVDKLLKQDGWILFDDYNWTYSDIQKQTGRAQTDGVNHLELGVDELENPHIKLIFNLLVMQHPDYSEFKIQDESWAYAKKVRKTTKTLKIESTMSLKTKLVSGVKKVKNIIIPSERFH